MTVTVYRSTDVGAPTVLPTGTSIKNLLNACLVVGYSSKTAAGWTMPYSSGNLSVFKQGTGSSGMYLRLDEGTVANVCLMRGYETMTAVSTGSRLFPTTAQETNGICIQKGTNENLVALQWIVAATSSAVWIFVKPNSINTGSPYDWSTFAFFGDIESYKTGDLYKCALYGPRYSEELQYVADPSVNSLSNPVTLQGITATSAHTCAARSYTGAVGSTMLGKHTDAIRGTWNIHDGGYIAFPNGADGGIYSSKIYLHEYNGTTSTIRGSLPGIWTLCHNISSFTIGNTFSGSGDFAGKTFEFIRVREGLVALETSSTW